jgi:hypothetical protein
MSYLDRTLSFLELLPEALGQDLQSGRTGARDSGWREARRRRLRGEGAPGNLHAPMEIEGVL